MSTEKLRRSRELMKQQTREALLEAGFAEFAEHGLDAPSVDSICTRAALTRGAFYFHFEDRAEFLVAVIERIIGPFLDAMIATGDAAQDLARTIDRFAEAAASAQRHGSASPRTSLLPPFSFGLAFHRLLEACVRTPQLRQRFVRLLQEGEDRLARAIRRGQGAGTVRDDVDAEQAAFVLVTVALGVVTAVEAGMPFDATRARAAVQRLLAAPVK